MTEETPDPERRPGPPGDAAGPTEIEELITQARATARAAGLLGQTADDTTQPWHASPKVSFVFELSGLQSPVQVAEIEAALRQLPGVMVEIVYPSATAWITAPGDCDRQLLAEVFARFGVSAELSDASQRRRALAGSRHQARLSRQRAAGRRRVGYGQGWVKRRRQSQQREIEQARRAGRLSAGPPRGHGQSPVGEVLYTARDLMNPQRLVLSAIVALPVLLLSLVPAWQFPWWQWVILALATPVVLWGAWPFHRALLGGIRRGLSALDGASSVAILSAYLWSVLMLVFTEAGHRGWHSQPQWFAFGHSPDATGELFLDVACGMTVLLLAGRALSRRTRTGLLEEMATRQPDPASPVQVFARHRGAWGGATAVTLPLSEVNVDDDILVPAGSVIPVDGQVVGGAALVAPGLVAASRNPGRVRVGSAVSAGARVLEGELKVRVIRTGHRTRYALIRRWVERAIRRQNHQAWLSTRSASLLIPAALIIAAVDFGMWWLITGNLNAAFATALAVLAGTAPVALALSTALTLRHGVEAVARRGILLRDEHTVANLTAIDTVIFNRSGTLAAPDLRVATVTAEHGEDPELVLRVAAALAVESDHPVSRALVHAARKSRDSGEAGELVPHWVQVHHGALGPEGEFTGMITLPRYDSAGEVQERQLPAVLWRPRTMESLRGRLAAAVVSGGTPLVVRWSGRDRGVITLHDTVREDAEEAVEQLAGMGVDTMMLSRDTYPVARSFADRIGIGSVLAGIAPGRKPSVVRAVHTRGARVAMVGDNSVTECLRVADVGILAGSSATLEQLSRGDDSAVDVVLLRDDVTAIPQLLGLTRRITRVINHNLVFSWAYHVAVAAAAISGVLHPMAATVLMLGASILIEARSNQARHF